MTKAIVLHETGGPDVFKWEDVEVSDPGPGEVRLRQTAVGLNFIDTHLRDGSYPLASLPATLGFEGAGAIGTAATLRHHPDDVLLRILDIAGFAVHAVGCVDLKSRLAVLLDDFVNACRAISLCRFIVLRQVVVNRDRFVFQRQM